MWIQGPSEESLESRSVPVTYTAGTAFPKGVPSSRTAGQAPLMVRSYDSDGFTSQSCKGGPAIMNTAPESLGEDEGLGYNCT